MRAVVPAAAEVAVAAAVPAEAVAAGAAVDWAAGAKGAEAVALNPEGTVPELVPYFVSPSSLAQLSTLRAIARNAVFETVCCRPKSIRTCGGQTRQIGSEAGLQNPHFRAKYIDQESRPDVVL